MSLVSTTLRPGLLVAVSTSIKGNVKYFKEDKASSVTGGTEEATWETTRIIYDREEQEEAVKVRSKARSLIASVCAQSAFGMLCPEDKKADLNAAFDEARKLCDAFNRSSKLTTVKFYAIAGRIAPDDVEAVKAINSEVRELLSEMSEGVGKLDVEVIRKAAARAKQLGNMLAPDAQDRIKDAVKAARDAATKMVKAGEQAAVEVDKTVLAKLNAARTAFLDLDDAAELATPAETSGRAIDLAPHEDEAPAAASATKVPTPQLEID